MVPWELSNIPDNEINAICLSPRLANINRLGEQVLRHEELLFVVVVNRISHRHRLRCCISLIQQRRICEVKPSQLHNHSLIVEEHLKPALCDLSLVRGVGSVPLRVLKHVTKNHYGQNARVVSLAVVVGVNLVERRDVAHMGQHLVCGVKAVDLLVVVTENLALAESD